MADFIQGHLDICNSDGISGWAWCPIEPLAKVDVLCTIDGHVIMCAPADQFRADLESAGIGNGQYAFTVKIPTRFYDGKIHTVSAQGSHNDTRFELIGSPTEFCLEPDRLIDGDFALENDGLLQGWVIDMASPSRTVSIDILAEGFDKISLLANIYRPDLLELGDGSGRHGFQIVLPRAWYEKPELTIQVRESKTGKPLNGKVVKFNTETSYFKLNQVLNKVSASPIPLQSTPTISVLLPVYNPAPHFLEEAIQSVKSQTYPFWQLCIADDASSDPRIERILKDHALQDDRIKINFRTENGHISEASNSALELVQGDFFALLDHDDLLHPDALLEVANVVSRNPEVGMIFTDEDKCDAQGMRYGPYCKTGWDPELLLGQNCVSHLGVYRTSLVREIGGFRRGFEGSQDYDLALRVSRLLARDQIRHIPRPLYHWRAIPGSTALANSEKSYAVIAMHKALLSHLNEIDSQASCEPAVHGAYCRVRWPIPSPPPSITLALPLAGHCASTSAFIKDVLALNWPGIQVVTCSIQASDPRADVDTRRLNYLKTMAEAAKGEIFVWLEQALPVGELAEWLNELISQALRDDIGIVGTKVIDQTRHVHNAGFTYLTPTDETQYNALYRGLLADDPGQGGAAGLCRTVQAVSAHAFACKRSTLLILLADPWVVQGTPIVTELSLRAEKRQLRTLVTPFAATILTALS